MKSILTYPNPMLRKIAEPVDRINEEIQNLLADMVEAMYGDDGVGLAAPQIGVSKSVIVVDAGEGLTCLINPEIVESDTKTDVLEEGCLSLPGIRIPVTRSTRIVVRGMDESGNKVERVLEGFMARVYQHEIDHVNGKLIIDHTSSIQKTLLKSKLRELEKAL